MDWPTLADETRLEPADLPAVAGFFATQVAPGFQEWPAIDPLDPPYWEPSLPVGSRMRPGRVPFNSRSTRSGHGREAGAAYHPPMTTLGTVGMVIWQDLDVEGQGSWWDGNRAHKCAYRYGFETFYHPYVAAFISQLRRDGLDGLLQRPLQLTPATFALDREPMNFDEEYDPTEVIVRPLPTEDVCFDIVDDVVLGGRSDAYGLYNSELFFHAPLLIADRLMQNQRFEDAQKWLHYIFDPTDGSAEKPMPRTLLADPALLRAQRGGLPASAHRPHPRSAGEGSVRRSGEGAGRDERKQLLTLAARALNAGGLNRSSRT